MNKIFTTEQAASRRTFLRRSSGAVLSASAIGALSGVGSMALAGKVSADDMSQDVAILNVALGLEHEGIAAYQLGAESGLLTKGVLDVAVEFQSHHKEHRDALIGAIQSMGGKPVEAKKLSRYAKDLNAKTLKSQGDILKLAVKLELGAANAYLGVIPSFSNSDLGQIAARLAADETMHWTALTSALGMALPSKALTFGA
ncbi:ferritin-like domain-containing protein [Kordiimonas aquimaris]|uniref:ferritin-like domain-containing protein n=1 Tax=Kordiimonas aquimaris TaxID=707591 RepID=UPI0021CEF256|nr:ferritin-like domain-containing protein [Kordiimonas aquimaris]